jgi:electron transfer flavoprotein alpha subunit
MAQASGVLVIAEHADGQLEPAALEAISAARVVADDLGGDVLVGVLGADIEGVAHTVADVAGVDEVVTASDGRLGVFNGPAWTAAISQMIEQTGPALVVAPATTSGQDYLPRVAARLSVGHAADAVDVAYEGGKIVATRPMLGSRVQAVVAFEGDGPATVTLRPGSFPRAQVTGEHASVRPLDVSLPEDVFLLQPSNPEGAAEGAARLNDAERIVAGGRGLGEPERFALVEELASVLNAAVAATRPLADAGWRPHADQIGQTGAAVSPMLYIAVGISGAVQHLVGIQNADYIVAINRDPNAPIFKVASFGIVGDLFEVVPAVIEELKSAQS